MTNETESSYFQLLIFFLHSTNTSYGLFTRWRRQTSQCHCIFVHFQSLESFHFFYSKTKAFNSSALQIRRPIIIIDNLCATAALIRKKKSGGSLWPRRLPRDDEWAASQRKLLQGLTECQADPPGRSPPEGSGRLHRRA